MLRQQSFDFHNQASYCDLCVTFDALQPDYDLEVFDDYFDSVAVDLKESVGLAYLVLQSSADIETAVVVDLLGWFVVVVG